MKINKMKLNQYYKNYKKHIDCCVFSEFSTKTQRRNTKQQLTFIRETVEEIIYLEKGDKILSSPQPASV